MLPYPDLPWKNETEFYNLHSKEIFSEFPFYHLSMVGNTKEEFLNYIIERARIDSNSKVIDLGCGSGYVVNSLSKLCKSIGISTSQECINQAKINYPDSNFEIANMETYSNENVTHFLCLESLHYSNVEKTFKNVYNNLIDGGIFYMKEWHRKFNENDVEIENRKHFEYYFKYRGITLLEIIKMGYESGFTLLSVNDISDKVNSKMYTESIKHHKAPLVLPHGNKANPVFPLSPTELLFIKK